MLQCAMQRVSYIRKYAKVYTKVNLFNIVLINTVAKQQGILYYIRVASVALDIYMYIYM